MRGSAAARWSGCCWRPGSGPRAARHRLRVQIAGPPNARAEEIADELAHLGLEQAENHTSRERKPDRTLPFAPVVAYAFMPVQDDKRLAQPSQVVPGLKTSLPATEDHRVELLGCCSSASGPQHTARPGAAEFTLVHGRNGITVPFTVPSLAQITERLPEGPAGRAEILGEQVR